MLMSVCTSDVWARRCPLARSMSCSIIAIEPASSAVLMQIHDVVVFALFAWVGVLLVYCKLHTGDGSPRALNLVSKVYSP